MNCSCLPNNEEILWKARFNGKSVVRKGWLRLTTATKSYSYLNFLLDGDGIVRWCHGTTLLLPFNQYLIKRESHTLTKKNIELVQLNQLLYHHPVSTHSHLKYTCVLNLLPSPVCYLVVCILADISELIPIPYPYDSYNTFHMTDLMKIFWARIMSYTHGKPKIISISYLICGTNFEWFWCTDVGFV